MICHNGSVKIDDPLKILQILQIFLIFFYLYEEVLFDGGRVSVCEFVWYHSKCHYFMPYVYKCCVILLYYQHWVGKKTVQEIMIYDLLNDLNTIIFWISFFSNCFQRNWTQLCIFPYAFRLYICCWCYLNYL